MKNYKHIFGPVPSRRMGESIGISPIPEKTCNYSCIYCQLGRTTNMTNKREKFYNVDDIVDEFILAKDNCYYDVVTIVGEGEPTLYSELGTLIRKLKQCTNKPIAVITNGALMYDYSVQEELMYADIVLPSVDGFDEESFKKIDRPMGSISFDKSINGLIEFSNKYKGQLLLEVMLVDGINTDDIALEKLKTIISKIKYDRVYINTPVRPPAEGFVQAASKEVIKKATELLNGISIDMLADGSFYSDIKDSFEAILNIAKRHPMNQFEIDSFLNSRDEQNKEEVFRKLKNDKRVTVLDYKGILTYRVN